MDSGSSDRAKVKYAVDVVEEALSWRRPRGFYRRVAFIIMLSVVGASEIEAMSRCEPIIALTNAVK